MKLLTFHGPGHLLDVPGCFTLALGESATVSDELAETLVDANPEIRFTVTDPDSDGITGRPDSGPQPAAHEGEGQTTNHTEQKEE